jgi:hypothetical protein
LTELPMPTRTRSLAASPPSGAKNWQIVVRVKPTATAAASEPPRPPNARASAFVLAGISSSPSQRRQLDHAGRRDRIIAPPRRHLSGHDRLDECHRGDEAGICSGELAHLRSQAGWGCLDAGSPYADGGVGVDMVGVTVAC